MNNESRSVSLPAGFAAEPATVLEELTEVNFGEEVGRSAVPVLAIFEASWCEPCRRLRPALTALAAEMGDDLRVVRVDIEKNPRLKAFFDARRIPALLLFVEGEIVGRTAGTRSLGEMRQLIEQHRPARAIVM